MKATAFGEEWSLLIEWSIIGPDCCSHQMLLTVVVVSLAMMGLLLLLQLIIIHCQQTLCLPFD